MGLHSRQQIAFSLAHRELLFGCLDLLPCDSSTTKREGCLSLLNPSLPRLGRPRQHRFIAQIGVASGVYPAPVEFLVLGFQAKENEFCQEIREVPLGPPLTL